KDSTGCFDKKTRRWDSDSDYIALANAIAGTVPNGQRQTNIFDMLDLPNVISYMVVGRFSHENDDVWANMTVYHDNDGDNLWRIIPFDMNLSWGAAFLDSGAGGVEDRMQNTNDLHKSFPMYGSSVALALTSGAWNRMYDVIFSVPQTREMFLRRMRTVLDTYVQTPDTHPLALYMEKKVRAWRDLIAEEAQRDRAKWGWPPKGGQSNFDPGIDLTNGVSAMLTEFVAKRRIHFYGKHSITNTALPVGISKTQNAGIPLAQPTNANVAVAALDYNPSSHNQAEEYVCLTNPNPYAVDLSGWILGGGVDFTFQPGTVMPSNSVLYVSPDLNAFRARAIPPHSGMGLFVVGPYKKQLSARGEPLTITDDKGRLVYTNVYQGSPSLPQQFLRITELMYNPSPLPGNTNDAQEFEYLELKNISASTTVDLTGVHFSNGVEFSFSGSSVTSLGPGQRVLVVKNLAAFTARYGGGFSIAGQYLGALENNGERIQLLDADNEEILDFSYNNSWYPITDGAGFSLVIVDENAEPDLWDNKLNWRPSGVVNGMPGQPDSSLPTIAPILVNEVLTHTDPPLVDAVELFNPTTSNVNLGGWFISDDFRTPKKYRIPNNTMIAAGGYLVFDETQFNTPSNAPTSFAFSSKGDEVYLFSGDGNTNLTGYVQGYAFGAAENGVSFGRYTNSVGAVHFVAQSANTLGSANAGPKVGPVVISEIMYHPPDFPGGQDNADDEYVELQNITGGPVPLFNPAAPTNTWRLRGGVDYDLPTNVTLTANGFLLVVNFDPTKPDNARQLASFRNKYALAGNVPIFGPYAGKLNNGADDVKLERPDTPEATVVPYILVDRVEYQDQAPWPVGADGIGASLQRIHPSQYGNDPINWTAGAPTAGGGFAGGSAPTIVAQPANHVSLASQSAMFSVMASGSGPLRYQWRFNGTNLDQGSGPTLTLSDLQLEQAGRYSVAVFNAAGAA
ncbi:MAG TPA: lamin tail domain-containing protein, partial [Candidatus Binatia bacterium]|nr:lamin tail domain-containing protein [Candidatus Binatia bacterium]